MPTLTHSKIIELYDALAGIKGALKEPLHRYRAAAMRRSIADVAESIIDQRKAVEDQRPNAYNQEREQIARDHAFKDKDGKPMIAGDQYVMDPNKKDSMTSALVVLKEKHKDAIDSFEKAAKDFNEFLKAKTEFADFPHKLKLSWFNESVDGSHLETLLDYVDEDVSEPAKPKP